MYLDLVDRLALERWLFDRGTTVELPLLEMAAEAGSNVVRTLLPGAYSPPRVFRERVVCVEEGAIYAAHVPVRVVLSVRVWGSQTDLENTLLTEGDELSWSGRILVPGAKIGEAYELNVLSGWEEGQVPAIVRDAATEAAKEMLEQSLSDTEGGPITSLRVGDMSVRYENASGGRASDRVGAIDRLRRWVESLSGAVA